MSINRLQKSGSFNYHQPLPVIPEPLPIIINPLPVIPAKAGIQSVGYQMATRWKHELNHHLNAGTRWSFNEVRQLTE